MAKEYDISKIDGWLTSGESSLLETLAVQIGGSGQAVEIGSWKGKSTCYIARGLMRSGIKTAKLCAIDPHTGSGEHRERFGKVDTYAEFLSNIKRAGVAARVKPVRKTSEQAAKGWKKRIELLFIDGDHSYEGVKMDFMLWEPHLADGGVVVFHDTTATSIQGMPGWPGPRRLVWEEVINSPRFRVLGRRDTMLYAEKCVKRTIGDSFRAYFEAFMKFYPDMLSKYFYGYAKRGKAANLAIKAALAPYLIYKKIKPTVR